MKFDEWLQHRDPELYQEINKKWLAPLLATSIGLGGLGGLKYSHSPSYETQPPIARSISQQAPIKITLSGSGPMSIQLDNYKILNSHIKDINIEFPNNVSYLKKTSIKTLINKSTVSRMIEPGKTGGHVIVATGYSGKHIPFKNQQITLNFNNRMFEITPDLLPPALKGVVNFPLRIQVSGTITFEGSGDVTTGNNDTVQ